MTFAPSFNETKQRFVIGPDLFPAPKGRSRYPPCVCVCVYDPEARAESAVSLKDKSTLAMLSGGGGGEECEGGHKVSVEGWRHFGTRRSIAVNGIN